MLVRLSAARARLLSSAGLLAAALIMPNAASAQEATQSSATAQSGSPATSPATPGDIVITAQRRSESLQRVPIAVTAFSQGDLTRLSIIEPRNLEISTPGLTFPEDNGTVNPYIRGKGTGFSGPGLEGSVAFYVDGVYIQDQYGVEGAFVDVNQVQVLKGPQGVLYGRNATGGAIVITTRDPTRDLGGYVQAGYGNLNWWRTEGVLNLPVTSTLSVRLVGSAESRDGYLTNVVDGEKQGRARKALLRGKALWEPFDGFSVLLKGEYQKLQSDYQRRQLLNGYGQPTSLGFYQTYQSPRNPTWRGGEGRFTVESGTLRLAYRTKNLSFVNTTGYRDTRAKFCSDGDFIYEVQNDFCTTNDPSRQPGLGNRKVNGFDARTLTNETSVSSTNSGPFNFLLGAYYQHSKAEFPAILRGTLWEDVLPGLLGTGPLVPFFDTYTSISSYAVYAEGYYNFTPELRLTVGGRYSKDRKKIWDYDNQDVQAGFGIPAAYFLPYFSQKASFSDFTPRVVLAYSPGNSNYYISYQQGFKSGGFNSPSATLQTPLRPEKITSVEVGAKYKLLDNRLHLNLAAFASTSTNVQVASINPTTESVEQRNAARVRARGAEADLQLAVSRSFSLGAGAAYLHSRFTSFPDAAIYAVASNGLMAATTEDLKGFPTPNSPTLTLNGNATYRFLLQNHWKGNLTVTGFHTSSYDLQAGAGGPSLVARQRPYSIVNLTGEISPTDHLTLSAYVNNLFRAHYYDQINVGSAGLNGAGGAYGVIGLPRTYGAAARYSF